GCPGQPLSPSRCCSGVVAERACMVEGGRAMSTTVPGCYAGKILRVDLTNNHIWTQPWTPAMCRTALGGVGLGAQILWEEVPPEVHWDHPENRLVMATGPLAGLPAWGTGALPVR